MPHITYEVLQMITSENLIMQMPLTTVMSAVKGVENFGRGLSEFVGMKVSLFNFYESFHLLHMFPYHITSMLQLDLCAHFVFRSTQHMSLLRIQQFRLQQDITFQTRWPFGPKMAKTQLTHNSRFKICASWFTSGWNGFYNILM